MTAFSFSDRELQLAAEQVRAAMLASLPEPADCHHTFSDAFLANMERLIRRYSRKKQRKSAMRSVAAVFLAILIGAAALFAFNGTVRAAVTQWVREFYETHIIYHYTGERSADVLPKCEVGWVPEDYTRTDEYRDEDTFAEVYENTEGEIFVITCTFMQSGSVSQIEYLNDTTYTHNPTSINGEPADFYIGSDGSSDLIVLNHQAGIEIEINGYLDEETAVRIAENIRFS